MYEIFFVTFFMREEKEIRFRVKNVWRLCKSKHLKIKFSKYYKSFQKSFNYSINSMRKL